MNKSESFSSNELTEGRNNMNKAEDLRFLIKAKYGSIKKLSEIIGISEKTIDTHIKDGNWNLEQACKLLTALKIPKKYAHIYLF